MNKIVPVLLLIYFSAGAQYGDLDDLSDSVRLLTGEVEELRREISICKEEIAKLQGIYKNLTEVKQVKEEAVSKNVQNLSPEALVTLISDLLKKKKASEARNLAKDFLNRNPKSIYAGMMVYYLGESAFIEHNYKKAIVEYANSYKMNPFGRKVPHLLLKLGMSFKLSKQPKEAKATFKKLLKDFPGADKAIITKAKAELSKCK